MNDTGTALGGLGFASAEEADQALEEAAERRGAKVRDPRICACGHVARFHQGRPGAEMCLPARMRCGCRKLDPVLEAEDTRLFLFTTTGWGVDHALAKGIRRSEQAGKGIEWLPGALKCYGCQKDVRPLTPCSVMTTPSGAKLSETSQSMNGLLCDVCFGLLPR